MSVARGERVVVTVVVVSIMFPPKTLEMSRAKPIRHLQTKIKKNIVAALSFQAYG